MKSWKGFLFIIGCLITSAILWYFTSPKESINTFEQLSYVTGGIAVTGFFLVFVLSLRSKVIEDWFNGFEVMYLYHKIIAVFAIAMTYVHKQLLELGEEEEKHGDKRYDFEDGYEGGYDEGFDLSELAKEFGELAQNGFIFLIIVAFFAKFLKYEHWRYVHRLMIIPYAMGIFHMYFTDKYDLFQLTPLSVFTAITSIIGLGAAIYMYLFYQRTKFKNKGEITAIKKLGSAIELEITLTKKLNFKEGQFIFLKVFQKDLDKAPHPFSISGGDGKKIYVTVKALGDFTKKLNDSIQLNTAVSIEGPYGHMDFKGDSKHQIWVAGGVGITPFMSFLKNNILTDDVELFYSYRGEEDALYKDFLEEYSKNNEHFIVHFINTEVDTRLSFKDYKIPGQAKIFMCGPRKMIKSLSSQLRAKNQYIDIQSEAFKFR